MTKDKTMNKRILITYATRTSSTSEIAAAVGETLGGRGFSVDVKPVKTNPSLNGYDAIVLGSAIRMGSWLPEMVDFIKANQFVLNTLPVSLFTVHILNTGDDETSRVARHAYLNNIRPLVKPVDQVFFTGMIDLEKLSLLDRMMVKMVKSPIGDYRDWNKIRGWAEGIL